MNRVYAKKAPLLQVLFSLFAVFLLVSCSSSPPWDGYNTGVVTRHPDAVPDIRWQTPDQREEVIRRKRAEAEAYIQNSRVLKPQEDEVSHSEHSRYVETADMASRSMQRSELERRMQERMRAADVPAYQQKEEAPLPVYKPVKVHLLLPLSGEKADLGRSMLNAAQMALFDVGSENFELVPVDTKGSKQGAMNAAKKAVSERSDLILGPIFSKNLSAIKPIVGKDIPIISFTNDWKLADNNTYILGFLPFTQVARVVRYAQRREYKNFAVYAPNTDYCDIAIHTLNRTLANSDAQVIEVGRYASKQRDISSLVADFVERNKILPPELPPEEMEIQPPETPLTPEEQRELEEEKARNFDMTFEVLMLPMGGESLKSIINQLEINHVDHAKVRYIGTGLWDDDRFKNFPSLYGGWFAAPDPEMRKDFEQSYRENFGEDPIRIASIAYDATALAAVLAMRPVEGNETPYTRRVLMNPRGFAGIDGIFRFRPDGLNERGLAVLQIEGGNFRVVDRAPTAFIMPPKRR